MNISKIFCPLCGAGYMEDIFPVHSYDYNKDGYIPQFCIFCGLCSDCVEKHDKISNRAIKKILKNISSKQTFITYKKTKEIYRDVKKKEYYTLKHLARDISDSLKSKNIDISFDSILDKIYESKLFFVKK
jgi:hypothetical protein